MNKKFYIIPRCEVMHLTSPSILSGSNPETEDTLEIGFSTEYASEDAF